MSDKKLLIKLAADVEGLKKGLRQASQQVDTFTSEVQKMGGTMAAVFSVKAIGNFVLEVSKLSGEATGVREAFERLPSSVKVMNDLKTATHNTVSEFDLMKRAVMASNFDISLKALPRLLEFATLRAKQTGQSIDYLVDSIVTGIGRKSKLILDNLGISAVQLTEALGGASTASSSIGEVADAVGRIAEENLKKMGTLSENASTKIERLNAQWINLKVAIGDAANSTGILGAVIDSVNDRMGILASQNLPAYVKLLALMVDETTLAKIKTMDLAEATKKLAEDQAKSESITRQAKQAIATFGTNLDAITAAYKQNINFQKIMNEVNRILIEDGKKKDVTLRNEANLIEQLNELKEKSVLVVGKERLAINLQIQALEKEIKALQDLGKEKDLQAASDIERLKRIRAVEDMYNTKPKYGVTTNVPGDTQGVQGNAYNSMRSAAEGLTKAIEKANKAQKKLDEDFINDQTKVMTAAARVGDAVGESFGNMISGSETFTQAMARMASQVVAAIQRIVIMRMIEKSFETGGPTPVAIALAAAGFAALRVLFNKAASMSGGASGTSNTGSMYSPAPSYRNGGFHLVAQVSGRQLQFVMKEQDTYDSRTKGLTGR